MLLFGTSIRALCFTCRTRSSSTEEREADGGAAAAAAAAAVAASKQAALSDEELVRMRRQIEEEVRAQLRSNERLIADDERASPQVCRSQNAPLTEYVSLVNTPY